MIAATTYTGNAINMPYQPCTFVPGSSTTETMPTPTMPNRTTVVIPQSRYKPVARANSVNAASDTSVKKIIVVMRPKNSATKTSGIITSHPRYAFHA